jgi:hypothetical protein
MMFRFLSVVIAIILLSGFSITVPIKGIAQYENSVITGSAKGYLAGNGEFNIASNTSINCEGIFDYIEGKSKPAVGGFKCDNGMQGDIVLFALNKIGTKGYGIAHVNNETYAQFIFGDVPDFKNMSWSTVKERYVNMSQQMQGHIYYCEEYPETLKCKK